MRAKNFFKSYLAFTCVVTLLAFLGLAPAADAAAPTLKVDAANIQLNSYSGSWACDAQTDLSHGPNCHSQNNIPVTYMFAYAPVIVQDPASGQYYFFSGGVSRDSGFNANEVRYDNLVSWEAAGVQGGTHTLREVNFEQDTPDANLHNVLRTGFYDSTFGEFFWFDTIFESGAFPQNKMSGISIHHGSNPTSPQNYDLLFKAHRPSGAGSGAEYHFNKGTFIEHPSSSTLWIGVTRAHHSGSGHNVITPILVDPSTETFWLHYANEGWCSYPWGTEFTGFNLSDTCSSGKSGGLTNTVIPDHYEGDSQWPFRYRGLANIDGKVILHGAFGTTRACGTDTTCMKQHALCPPESFGFDHDLYVERSQQHFTGGYRFLLREAPTSNWSTASTSWSWTGGATFIQDGTQPAKWELDPTDNRTIGPWGQNLTQYPGGGIYLYLSAKMSWCEPSESGTDAWNRFPDRTSGTSYLWYRLSKQ